MNFVLLCIMVLLLQVQDLPYKSKEEFDIQLDYKFRQRPSVTAVKLNETLAERDRRTSTSPLPYLILRVKFLKLNNETRLRLSNNKDKNLATRKIAEGMVLPIEIGFTADVKDRVRPHQYTVTFLSPERKETSRILINVDEDGSFFVNEEKRGKF